MDTLWPTILLIIVVVGGLFLLISIISSLVGGNMNYFENDGDEFNEDQWWTRTVTNVEFGLLLWVPIVLLVAFVGWMLLGASHSSAEPVPSVESESVKPAVVHAHKHKSVTRSKLSAPEATEKSASRVSTHHSSHTGSTATSGSQSVSGNHHNSLRPVPEVLRSETAKGAKR